MMPRYSADPSTFLAGASVIPFNFVDIPRRCVILNRYGVNCCNDFCAD
jgi:hypothetical protein